LGTDYWDEYLELTGGWGKLHNEEFHSSSDNIIAIKERGMR
jgi:hypothetical protein